MEDQSRRQFLEAVLVGGIGLTLTGCTSQRRNIQISDNALSLEEEKYLDSVYEQVFHLLYHHAPDTFRKDEAKEFANELKKGSLRLTEEESMYARYYSKKLGNKKGELRKLDETERMGLYHFLQITGKKFKIL